MNDVLTTLTDYVHEHWIKFLTGAFFMGLGWLIGKWRARVNWTKKEFLDRLNVSLNVFHEGKLLIRTILEESCREIFLNTVAVDTIATAAYKTTEDDPILPLPDGDYWYYLNAVLNEVSERFALGQLKRAVGEPVRQETFLICLTSECAGTMRTRKVRAMLVQKKILQNLPKDEPQYESPTHATRWKTLQKLSAEFVMHPQKFIEVEICL